MAVDEYSHEQSEEEPRDCSRETENTQFFRSRAQNDDSCKWES